MFRIAKAEELKDYKMNISLEKCTICDKNSKREEKHLNIDVVTKEYTINLLIEKDIEEILNMKN